eukprot:14577095-Alexandrium_andersonii.AAC.1
MLATRLQRALEPAVRATQYGFRHRKSTLDAILVIRRYLELADKKPSNSLHMVFIDWEKAFDKINPGAIPRVLERFGAPGEFIEV